MRFQSINPANGETIATWTSDSDAAIELVLDQSVQAYHTWSRVETSEREGILRRLSSALREQSDDLALLATREMGKPISQAKAELQKCALLCDHYADQSGNYLKSEDVDLAPMRGRIVYQPMGPVFSITPWNFPFWQVLRFAIPSLALGNTVILKHAPNVLGCAQAIENLFKSIGAPEHIFQQVVASNDQARKIIQDDRIIGVALTGSERAGAAVAGAAGAALKKCVLELGGSDPFIVLEDADFESAASAAAQSRFANAGQICIAAKRMIVATKIMPQFTEAFVAATKKLLIGNPEAPETFLGPMARRDLREELTGQVQASIRLGAKPILSGGPVDGPGNFFSPVILADTSTESPMRRQEIFGPATAIIEAMDDQDVSRLANNSAYGLSASVWSNDIERAENLALGLETGNVFINAISGSDTRMPFGGIKRSGFGRELGRDGMLEFANAKSITIAG